MDLIDELKHLAVSDRLRVCANLIDDAVAGRIDRHAAIKRVLHIVSLAVRTIIKELYRGGQPCSVD